LGPSVIDKNWPIISIGSRLHDQKNVKGVESKQRPWLGGGSFTLRFGSTRYWVGSTRSILLEVRLEGMVGKNLLLESTYNICVLLSSVFRTDYL